MSTTTSTHHWDWPRQGGNNAVYTADPTVDGSPPLQIQADSKGMVKIGSLAECRLADKCNLPYWPTWLDQTP